MASAENITAVEGRRAPSKRRRVATPEPPESALEEVLRSVMLGMRNMHEEQIRLRGELAEVLRRNERRTQPSQLSPSGNSGDLGAGPIVATVGEGDLRIDLGYKLKPDIYDGTIPLREFFSQFNLIANANRWNDALRAVALASCLRGRARSVLDSVQDAENLNFAELKSKLELCFGEGSSQNYYVLFTSRRQKFGEDFASLGLELERLSRLAYPECPLPVRDKMTCAQFITAISDNFVRRTLQLEGVSSLIAAVERAKVIKAIQDENFERRRTDSLRKFDKSRNFIRNFDRKNFNENRREEKRPRFEKEGKSENKRQNFKFTNSTNSTKECWQCGKTAHFRAECPSFELEKQSN